MSAGSKLTIATLRPLVKRLRAVRTTSEFRDVFENSPEAEPVRLYYKFAESKLNRWMYYSEKFIDRHVHGKEDFKLPAAKVAFMVHGILLLVGRTVKFDMQITSDSKAKLSDLGYCKKTFAEMLPEVRPNTLFTCLIPCSMRNVSLPSQCQLKVIRDCLNR